VASTRKLNVPIMMGGTIRKEFELDFISKETDSRKNYPVYEKWFRGFSGQQKEGLENPRAYSGRKRQIYTVRLNPHGGKREEEKTILLHPIINGRPKLKGTRKFGNKPREEVRFGKGRRIE